VIDKQLQSLAVDWADKVFQDIYTACHSPEHVLYGESLKMYKILSDWGWFELCPIEEDQGEAVTRQWLAMNKYAKLEWAKRHPGADKKIKPSKWDIVTGRAKRK